MGAGGPSRSEKEAPFIIQFAVRARELDVPLARVNPSLLCTAQRVKTDDKTYQRTSTLFSDMGSQEDRHRANVCALMPSSPVLRFFSKRE